MNVAPPLTPFAALIFCAIALAAGVLSFRRSWFAPAVVMLTAPYAWYHTLGPTEITVSKAAFVGALLGVVSACARDARRRSLALASLRASPALIALAALAVWSGLSVLWAATPSDAVRDALKWLWYCGVFALTLASIEEPDDRDRVLGALFVSAAIVGLYGLYQGLHAPPAGFVAPSGAVVGRIAGTLEGPNQFGGYLEAALPPLLALLLAGRLSMGRSIAGGLLLGLLLADLLLTYSRGALWATALAVVVVAAAAWRVRRSAEAGSARPVLAGGICALAVLVPVVVSSISVSGWQHELWAPGVGDTTVSEARRVELWTCAGRLFSTHPLAGVGGGNFADVKATCGDALAGPDHFNANEWYLETAADLGVVGLAALLVFIASLLSAARFAAVWRDPIAFGCYAAVIAFAAHGLVDDVEAYPKAALSFFVVAGVLSVCAARASAERASGARVVTAGGQTAEPG